MAAKLTPTQKELLADISRRPSPVSITYSPAKALVSHGLAVWKDAMFCDVLEITEEGRAHLKDQPQ